MNSRVKDIQWLARWCKGWQLMEARNVRLTELSEFLNVTRRTVQYWLQRLESDGWILWVAVHGRGHLPRLTLLKLPSEYLQDLALKYINKNELDQALSLVPESGRSELLSRMLEHENTVKIKTDLKLSQKPSRIMIPFYRAIHDLDPITSNRRTEAHLLSHIHARLVEFDEETQTLKPSLAHHWEKIEKGYRFYLRKAVLFHDGSSLTAHDVKRCLLLLKNSNHSHSAYAETIESIDVIHSWCLEIKLNSKNELLLNQLALACASIFKEVDFQKDPIGCGEFVLKSRTHDKTTLHAFDGYFGLRPLCDEIHIWTVGASKVRLNENAHILLTGNQAQSKSQSGKILAQAEIGASWILFNQAKRGNHFNQKNNREFLVGLLDFSSNKVNSRTKQLRAHSFLPNRERQEVNFTEKIDTHTISKKISLLTYQYQGHIELANWIQSCLSKNGIQVEITVMLFPDFYRKENVRKYDLIVTGEVFGADILLSYFEFMKGNLLLETCLLKKQQVVINKKLKTITSQSKNMSKGFEELEDDCISNLLWYPLFHSEQKMLSSKVVHGQTLNSLGWLDFGKIWI